MKDFQSYYVMRGGPNELMSVTMFLTKEASNASALANRRWQEERLLDQEVTLLNSWNGDVLVHGAR
jgi:hypothetical protein